MRRGRTPRGERGVLLVPVLPGSSFEPSAPAAPSQARRLVLIAGAVVAVVAIGLATVFLARGPSQTKKATVTAPVTVATTSPAKPVVQVTPAERAQTLAGELASKLPVALASTALLRSGGDVYAVGGTGRDGKPADGIWRIDLATGHFTRAGTFVEPLEAAGIARSGGALYLAGGWTGAKLATAVLRWVPGQTATLVARLPVALRGASAGFAGSVLYVTKGKATYEIDVRSGSVTSAAQAPAKLTGAGSNLAYLAQSLLAARG